MPSPDEIVIVDSSSTDGTLDIAHDLGCKTITIERDSFDHGATRNLGASISNGDVLVFMSQDALPASECSLGYLIGALDDRNVVAAYGRHVPSATTATIDGFIRYFNYPPRSSIRTLSDRRILGAKVAFFSNVFSAIKRTHFEDMNGFPQHIVTAEDVHFAAMTLLAGKSIAYVAEATVRHSHTYGWREQFRRNFDIGASYESLNVVLDVSSVGNEGLRCALLLLRGLLRERAFGLLPWAALDLSSRWLGYQLGYRHKMLPRWCKPLLGMNSTYWAAEIRSSSQPNGRCHGGKKK